jgi:uncharacterized damage-inducible protein DinB
MNKADALTIFDYVYWVNHRLLDAADALAPGDLAAPTTITTRDLRATLVHELDVEWSWRLNVQERLSEDEGELNPDDYPDVASIREHWQRDEADMRAWLGSLSDEQLSADVTSGLTRDSRPLWHYLMHIVMHAAQQQADAATLLSLAGRSPGDLGFLEYLMTTRPQTQP